MTQSDRSAADREGPSPDLPWSAVVIARNEAVALPDCLRALARSAGRHRLHVTLLLNGTTDRSPAVVADALSDLGLHGCVYTIPHGDKSNAINLFLHSLRPPAGTYFFTDGYAAVRGDALALLADALARHPHAHAAAAVPSTGPSAEHLRRSMVANAGLHGSLFAMRASFVERLVAARVSLPVGLYRGDGLLGSFVMHDLDAQGCPWDPSRVVVVPDATWMSPELRPWRPGDVRRYLQRLIRQGQGRLESAAIRDVIYRGGFSALPDDVGALIAEWISGDPPVRTPSPRRDLAAALAWRALRRRNRPDPDSLRPTLWWRSGDVSRPASSAAMSGHLAHPGAAAG